MKISPCYMWYIDLCVSHPSVVTSVAFPHTKYSIACVLRIKVCNPLCAIGHSSHPIIVVNFHILAHKLLIRILISWVKCYTLRRSYFFHLIGEGGSGGEILYMWTWLVEVILLFHKRKIFLLYLPCFNKEENCHKKENCLPEDGL